MWVACYKVPQVYIIFAVSKKKKLGEKKFTTKKNKNNRENQR